jgi:oxygen-dependent protoporphyrinogen oxidase
MKQVCIIGAGISGLATAYYLRRGEAENRRQLHVSLFESDSRPGGRIWTVRGDGFQVEVGASGFLDSKPAALELCRAIGLGSELAPAREAARTRYIFWPDRLQPLPTGPWQFLRSGLLSLTGKLRLLGERFVPRRIDDSDESVYDFAARRIGHEAAQVLVDAMVTGIQAGDPTLLSVRASFPRMVELERQYGGLLRALPRVRRARLAAARAAGVEPPPSGGGPGGRLYSLRGGMGQLIERLTELTGGTLTCNASVTAVRPTGDGRWQIGIDGRPPLSCDAVVLACPSFVQARLLGELDAPLASELAQIRYNSVVVVALGYRRSDLPRPLDGFGYLSPQRSRRDVLGVLWTSSIYEHRAPADSVLLQAMCGGWNRPEIVTWDDATIRQAVAADLRQTMDITASPTFSRVIRWPQAIPQYHVGHLDRLSRIEAAATRYPGLFQTGNSFRGIAVNDCIEQADRCAAAVQQYLGQFPPKVRPNV